FLRRIIRALARIEPGEDQALRLFAEALGRFADGLQRTGSRPQGLDPRTAHEILRLRKLGSMLRAEQDLLAAYYDALRTDPEVQENLERLRSEREAEIRKSTEDLSARMTADLERRIALRSAEFDAELAERERQAHQALEAALTEKRIGLEAAVTRLEDRHVVL